MGNKHLPVLIVLLNVATDQSKSFGHIMYNAQRDKKTIKKTS